MTKMEELRRIAAANVPKDAHLFLPKETTVPDPKTEAKTETPARRGLDPELQAVAKIDRILADLDPLTAVRVLEYLSGKSRHRMEDTFTAGHNDRFRPVPGFGPGVGESGDR